MLISLKIQSLVVSELCHNHISYLQWVVLAVYRVFRSYTGVFTPVEMELVNVIGHLETPCTNRHAVTNINLYYI